MVAGDSLPMSDEVLASAGAGIAISDGALLLVVVVDCLVDGFDGVLFSIRLVFNVLSWMPTSRNEEARVSTLEVRVFMRRSMSFARCSIRWKRLLLMFDCSSEWSTNLSIVSWKLLLCVCCVSLADFVASAILTRVNAMSVLLTLRSE